MRKRKVESVKDAKVNAIDEYSPHDASPSEMVSFTNSKSSSANSKSYFSQFTLSTTLSSQARYAQALLFLTIIGAFLRFYHLGYNPIWLDEAVTYSYAQKSFFEIWNTTVGGEFNPPFFYWVEHIMLFLGNSEVVLRLIPAILGVLTIPLFYLIGKELVDRDTGLIAAAILSFSPFHVYYSQEARAYAGVLFLASLALIFYLRAHRSNELKYWVLFAVFSALAFWTHFYSIILTGTLVLFEFITQARNVKDNPSELKPVLFALVAFVIFSIPLLVVTIRLFISRTSERPTFGVQGMGFINELIREFSGYSSTTKVILVILFVIGIIQLIRTEKTKFLMPVTVIAVTFLVSLVLSYKMPMLPRYLIFILPFLYIGAAAAYKPIYMRFSYRAIIYIFIIALFAINVPFYHEYYSDYFKSDWRDFALELQNVTHEGDLVIVIPDYIRVPLNYYYSNTSDHTLEYGASKVEDLERLRGSSDFAQTFFVSTDDVLSADPTGRSFQWLQDNSFLIKRIPQAPNKATPRIWLYQLINKSNPLAWYNKGLALYKSGKYNESLQAYNKAIEIAPMFASAWYNKGIALKAIGRSDDANAAFTKAVALAKAKKKTASKQ